MSCGIMSVYRSHLLPSNLVNGTGSVLISSVVKTELKYSFRTSAI